MTVYIVQDQKEVDVNTGQLTNKFDFSPAKEYGDLEYILPSGASPFNIDPAITKLFDGLVDFSSEDYLLLTGNPVLLGLAVTVACSYTNGNVKLLQWSGAKRKYIPIKIQDLFNY
jgi:hypothetical protein